MKIHIEYCERWNYHPEFDRVSKIIQNLNSNIDIKGNTIEPRTGSFEVKIDGKIVFSKLKRKVFPSNLKINLKLIF